MNLFTIFLFVVIAISGFTLLSFGLDEITSKNVILDDTSNTIISEFQTDVSTNLLIDDVDTKVSNLTVNGTLFGTDDFSREFRISFTQVDEQKNRIEKIASVPSVVVKSFGIPQNDVTLYLLTTMGIVIGFIIILSIYIAWKTGEVKNP